jgi:hypothetical protein
MNLSKCELLHTSRDRWAWMISTRNRTQRVARNRSMAMSGSIPWGWGREDMGTRQIRRSSTASLYEAKRSRSFRHTGTLLRAPSGQKCRFGMVGAGRILVTGDGTDWRFLDELKRELKDVR